MFFSFLASFPHGSIRVDDGNMTHFVADNLEYKIKTSSPKDGKMNFSSFLSFLS